MNSWRWWEHAQDRFKLWDGEEDMGSRPNQEAVCNWCLLGKAAIIFLIYLIFPQWSVYRPHSTGRAPSPEVVGLHKINSMFLCTLCLELENMMGGQGRSGSSRGRGKHMIKIYCIKIREKRRSFWRMYSSPTSETWDALKWCTAWSAVFFFKFICVHMLVHRQFLPTTSFFHA